MTRTETLPFSLPGPADWVILTSPIAVEVLASADVELSMLGDQIAAVGPATARAIEELDAHADVVPSGRSDAEALVAALIDAEPEGATAFIPGSALSRPTLADGLIAAGVGRRTSRHLHHGARQGGPGGAALVGLRRRRPHLRVDRVRHVVRAGRPPAGVAVIAFGQPTASAATRDGWQVDAIAATQDAPGVIDALTRCLDQENS